MRGAVLGLNTGFHDSAVCLTHGGEVLAALEEERWSRDDKHSRAFPARSLRYALEVASARGLEVEQVGINFDPARALGGPGGARTLLGLARKRLRRNRRHLARVHRDAARQIRQGLRAAGRSAGAPLHLVPHHDAHAASAFFASPFAEAAVLTIDGCGEWATTTFARGRGARLERLATIGLPHTLGGVYGAITEHLGFRRNEDEYKVMGLASAGDAARFREALAALIWPEGAGFRVDTRYFECETYDFRAGARLSEFLGPPRAPKEPLDERARDLAAALQERTEAIGVHLARALHAQTGGRALCLAGGVALNGALNARLLEETPFEALYVPPAASDAGGALGASLWVEHQLLGRERGPALTRADLGPSYDDAEVEAILRAGLLRYRRCADLPGETAAALRAGKIVGWFQGRAEFGPRALGQRSILADPTRPEMQDHLNARVKGREAFRPFAPAATEEGWGRFFETRHANPFMTSLARVRAEARALLPAVTHVDGTARLQVVSRSEQPRFHALLEALEARGGPPVVLNTSFNVAGEPIVLSPKDAIRCFFTTGLDLLAIGSFHVEK